MRIFRVGSGPATKDIGPPDFHVRIKGTPESLGRPSREGGPGHVPVYVVHHKVDPDFAFLAAQHAHVSSKYRQHARGTTALQHIPHAAVHDVLTAVITGKHERVVGRMDEGLLLRAIRAVARVYHASRKNRRYVRS